MTDTGELARLDALAAAQFCRGTRKRRITQAMIDTFANTADDHQWIHTDTARAARESPHKKTIAHGDLIFALRNAVLPIGDVIQVEDARYAIHRSGLYKLKAPVLVDQTVYGAWRMPKAPVLTRGMLVVHFDYKICIVEQSDAAALEGSVKVLFFH